MKIPKALVPKHKIRPVHPVCVRCQGPMHAVMATAYADGYFRRHVCNDAACDTSLYTLADYDSDKVKYSATPPKDRALTELELLKRDQWWEEDVTNVLLAEMMPWDIPKRMMEALRKKEEKCNELDRYLRGKHDEMLAYIYGETIKEISSEPEN